MGALGALGIAPARRTLTVRSFWRLLLETGQITVAVLFLILAATFFTHAGQAALPAAVSELLLSGPVGPMGFLLIYLALIIALGCLIDPISIMLIVLPIALPVAEAAGFGSRLVRGPDCRRRRDRSADAALRLCRCSRSRRPSTTRRSACPISSEAFCRSLRQ